VSANGWAAALRWATITAPASAASTTVITHGSSTTRTDAAQLAAKSLTVSTAKTANTATPAPNQAARPARFGSQTLYSGIPAFTGTRAPAGSTRAAYPAVTAMLTRSIVPSASATTTGPSFPLPYPAR
jgi:hypothetical protein